MLTQSRKQWKCRDVRKSMRTTPDIVNLSSFELYFICLLNKPTTERTNVYNGAVGRQSCRADTCKLNIMGYSEAQQIYQMFGHWI